MKFDTVLKDEQRVEGKRCMLSLHILSKITPFIWQSSQNSFGSIIDLLVKYEHIRVYFYLIKDLIGHMT